MEEKVKHPIIVITGPTASGKTLLSLELAREFGGEIICADSMTVYKGMDIGTDKPSAIQNSKFRIQNEPHPVIPDSTSVIPAKAGIQSPSNIDSRLRGNDKNESRNDDTSGSEITIEGIPHHMIDIKNPDEEFNVSIFKDLAEKKIKEIHTRGNIPFLVGGSTMYIDALVYKYDIPSAKPNLKLRAELEKESNDELFEQLVELDPDAQVAVDKNNKRRLIRALEVCLQTGKPFTQQKKKQKLPKNVLYLALLPSSVIPATRPAKPWRSWKAGIQKKEIDSGQARMTKEIGRQKLYQKINKRVDEMLAEGFLDEVKKLHKKYDLNTAMQATGYRQLAQYLEGEMSLKEAIEKTKQAHRNYAKRQLTWLRRNPDVTWIKDKKEAEKLVKEFLYS